MTREEAVKQFESELKWAELNIYPYVSKQKIEADKMAIEALEQEPCEDAISRQAVLEVIRKCHCEEWVKANIGAPIEVLSPVAPQPKTGHWIEHPYEAGENWEYSRYECSECHVWEDDDSNYCPNCGTKMEVDKCQT